MNQYLAIRKNLYQKTFNQVQEITGRNERSFKKYQKEYESIFNLKWIGIEFADFFDQINKSKIILIADFHASQQSQKGQLRIIRNLKQKPDFLGVECIESKYQNYLDQYLSEKISEETFLKRVKWNESWGFPWTHYRDIFNWAKLNKIPLIGLNKNVKVRGSASLKARDLWAAKIIEKLFKNKMIDRGVIIYGDLHLAQNHLPKIILRSLPFLDNSELSVVYQNSAKIYFQLMEKNREHIVDVIKLKKNSFCVINTPPWLKWQEYLEFLENRLLKNPEDHDLLNETLEKYYDIIKKDLGLNRYYINANVYSSNDDLFFEKLAGYFSNREQKEIFALIKSGKSFYLPNQNDCYLSRKNLNQISEMAVIILYYQYHHHVKYFSTHFKEKFEQTLFLQTIMYLGSKLINPKRKSNTLLDLKLSLGFQSYQNQKEILKLSIQLIDVLKSDLDIQKFLNKNKLKDQISYFEVARIMAGIIGEKYYSKLQSKTKNKKKFRESLINDFFKISVEDSEFSQKFNCKLKKILKIQDPYLSKNEKL